MKISTGHPRRRAHHRADLRRTGADCLGDARLAETVITRWRPLAASTSFRFIDASGVATIIGAARQSRPPTTCRRVVAMTTARAGKYIGSQARSRGNRPHIALPGKKDAQVICRRVLKVSLENKMLTSPVSTDRGRIRQPLPRHPRVGAQPREARGPAAGAVPHGRERDRQGVPGARRDARREEGRHQHHHQRQRSRGVRRSEAGKGRQERRHRCFAPSGTTARSSASSRSARRSTKRAPRPSTATAWSSLPKKTAAAAKRLAVH